MKELLINPFRNYSEKKLLLSGIIGTLLLVLLCFVFNTLIIGNLKIIFLDKILLKNAIITNAIIIIITTSGCYILGKIKNKKTRVIDILNAVLISRIPFCIFPLLNVNNQFYEISERIKKSLIIAQPEKIISADVTVVLFLCIPTIFGLVWSFRLLYNGFKIATNTTGQKSLLHFIITILIIEILTRTIISNFL